MYIGHGVIENSFDIQCMKHESNNNIIQLFIYILKQYIRGFHQNS